MEPEPMLVQLTSPGGVAAPRHARCPRCREGLPDRDDASLPARRAPAQWVRSRGARLHPPSAGTRLVSWPSIVPTNYSWKRLEGH